MIILIRILRIYISLLLNIISLIFKDHLLSNGVTMNVIQKEDGMYGCDTCDFQSKMKWNVKNHIKRVHQKQRDFHCDHCDYTCFSSSDFMKHNKSMHMQMLYGNVEKQHECLTCRMTTKTTGLLQAHVDQVHNLNKPFKC